MNPNRRVGCGSSVPSDAVPGLESGETIVTVHPRNRLEDAVDKKAKVPQKPKKPKAPKGDTTKK